MRCEPPSKPDGDLGSPDIAAALLLGAGQWRSRPPAAGTPPQQQQQQQAMTHLLAPAAAGPAPSGQALQPMVLQSLSLWVAPADGGTLTTDAVTPSSRLPTTRSPASALLAVHLRQCTQASSCPHCYLHDCA